MIDREPPVTEEELHAYVDGQLPADRGAAVAQWLDAHPEDAARVAAWRAQADAIRARYDAVASEPVPPRFELKALARAGRKWSRLAAAAVLAAFLLGGGAGWFGRGFFDGAGPTRAVTVEAFEAHRLYIGEVRHPIEVKAGESHLNRWLSRRVGYEMPTPNLDPFGLKLLGGRLLPGNAGRYAALYMYEVGERRAFHHLLPPRSGAAERAALSRVRPDRLGVLDRGRGGLRGERTGRSCAAAEGRRSRLRADRNAPADRLDAAQAV